MVYIFPQPGWEHLWTLSVGPSLVPRGAMAFNRLGPPIPATPVISRVLTVMGSGAILTYFWSGDLASPPCRDSRAVVAEVPCGASRVRFCPAAPWSPMTRWVSQRPLWAAGGEPAGIGERATGWGCSWRTSGPPRSIGGLAVGDGLARAEGERPAGLGLFGPF